MIACARAFGRREFPKEVWTMHILVTNDDGVQAPGLLALVQALRGIPGAEVSVLAPHKNWSVTGHSKTLDRPLRVWPVRLADGTPAWASDGGPADCVALAVLGVIEARLDLVVSGINPHGNLGHDVTYSGTVAAAMEAVLAGVPGLAVSLEGKERLRSVDDYRAAAAVAGAIAAWVLAHGLPGGVFLNVNVPHRPAGGLRGVQLTRLGRRIYRDRLVRREDPWGRPYYWIGGERPTGVPEPGTDIGALAEGWVSVTPLHMDLTATHALEVLADLAQEGVLGNWREIP